MANGAVALPLKLDLPSTTQLERKIGEAVADAVFVVLAGCSDWEPAARFCPQPG
jgi:hypothetical protein